MARYIEISKLPNFEVTCSNGEKYILLPYEHLFDIPEADVAPRAEVEKIIEEVKKRAEAYFWHQDSVATSCFIEFCDELKKKYTEGKDDT